MKFVQPDGTLLPNTYWREGISVLYFGFSHCPDLCPLTLTNFGRASLILGERSNHIRFVFITLDPERDAPSTLARYVEQFPGKTLTALSPDSESLSGLQDLFGVIRKKVHPNRVQRDGYSIDHSNYIYILDRDLNQKSAFPGGTSATTLANRLRELDVGK